MITTNPSLSKLSRQFIFIFSTLLLSSVVWSQQTPTTPATAQDTTNTNFSLGRITMPNPSSIVSRYTYDPLTDRYVYTETVGEFKISYPLILTPDEYQKLVIQESMQEYYKTKIDAVEGKKAGTEEEQKNLLPDFYVDSGFFETLFGGNTISVVPQGSVEMDLGFLYSKQDNPTFSPRNRSNFSFDFDQRISLSLLGKVGTRLQVTANYDTQSTFDFQNVVKLEYTPTEDDIVRKIEVGNVSMPLNSALITGAQSLFGVKTQLQFGKTTVTAVFSEQKSQSQSVVAEGGGTVEEFEFFARDYDENRHFFLAHYFRDTYNESLLRYPFINNNIQITRVEVWITNRSNRTENVRNIVAFQDLGESDNIGLDNPPGGFVNVGAGAFPDNGNNDFDPTNIGGAGSLLTNAVRDVSTVEQGILTPANEGFDFGKLENARKLELGREFTLNERLGYISLNQRLLNDEILAVAFQYAVGGEVYQVGEFANDGIDATGVTIDQGTGNQIVNNNNLVLKMLKSAITSVQDPIWDLMMKNIYDTGAFQLSREDFRLNIFYTEASPLNYIAPVEGTVFPPFDNNSPFDPNDDSEILDTPLIRLFHLDRLNFNNDPQLQGDGFFDFVPGTTVLVQNGKIVFTKVEPFGRYLFDILDDDGNPNNNEQDYESDIYTNPNHEKYVYDILYKQTKTAALDEAEKNKFQLKGRFKSEGADGIPLGAFNVPQGSVIVRAGGRTLVEGIDYTVNYQLGRVQILDEALKASNTPITVDVENNAIFGQQTRRFTGLNVEHQFTENFLLGATFLNLSERPITQKANYNSEPINNTILGANGNFSSEVPFLTRMVNKLPNIDTDVPSNFSVRGEVAYLFPGAPKGTDFNNEATAYVDDFEGTQGAIDLKQPQSWSLSSRPIDLGRTYAEGDEDTNGVQNGFDRAFLNWYSIDPIFYGSRRPDGFSDEDLSNVYTRRVFVDEIFPQIDLVQGATTVINTLDLVYYPNERGPYNFSDDAQDGILSNPSNSWAGITRQITSTDFEQANVEYIEFWVQDPFLDNPTNPGGKLTINLGNISEDILKDGKKQYENGLPEDGNIQPLLPTTTYGTVVPRNQALVYTFSTVGDDRALQDVGLDGFDDAEEAQFFPNFANFEDPSNDNYVYFLNTEGNIFDRYKRYNGTQGNSPDVFTETNRGAIPQPDVEDINRDNTMNTINSYFEYEVEITPNTLNINNEQINDIKIRNVTLPNGDNREVVWYQFRLPINEPTEAVGGIQDIRSVRFARLYLEEFTQNTILRFATLDLVRSDWRRYPLSLDEEPDNSNDDTELTVGVIGLQENEGNYVSPPGVRREQLNNNNNIIRQNEQSLVVETCNLEDGDARGVYKNVNVDMRQYNKLRMFIHLQEVESSPVRLFDGEVVGFIRMGNDFTENFYQIEVPLQVSSGTPTSDRDVWPEVNELNLELDILEQIKSLGISNGTLANEDPTFYDVEGGELTEVSGNDPYELGRQRVAIKGNPNFGDIRVLMVGLKNPGENGKNICAQAWFNELRLSDLDNEGGWAAVASMDTNIADFATLSATGRQSTIGFGGVEQRPNERSREDVVQYDVVTNINAGQLLPKKWGLQVPFNFAQGEEIITPEYDEFYRDIKLDTQLEGTTNRDSILTVNENYTKRRSINFIGVKKNRTEDQVPHFYDIENFTFNYSHNKVEHRDFEIENSLEQNIRTGVTYNYSFDPKPIEPFKKNDSLFRGRYFKILKDFNFNYLPASFSAQSDIVRQFSKQKFREVDLVGNNIGIPELFRRNYTFNNQYAINYNLTNSLSFNFTAANSNIVRNYFINDIINGRQDPTLDVWDGFFDPGTPNIQSQQLQLNYEIPLYKIPTLEFLRATYSYTGDFQWQKGSDLNNNLPITDDNGNTQFYNLGNSIQNANTHNLSTTLSMDKLYKYVGLVKKPTNTRRPARSSTPPGGQANDTIAEQKPGAATKIFNTGIGILTSIKQIQINYRENNGTFLPGYLRTPGFIGTLKPTLGYTFGSQSDIREYVASQGWLTVFPDFNQQYSEVENRVLDVAANVELIDDLTIDLTGNRLYSETTNESFRVEDLDGNNELDYNALITNSFGNFNISTALIKTAFNNSDENSSEPFNDFRANRLIVANRLATQFYGSTNFGRDAEGYPLGFGKNNQKVLLPSFLSAYHGTDPEKISLSAFRDIPIPNWQLKYTGFMKLKWFKEKFKRFSVTHGYRSGYTINQFRTNLDYEEADPTIDYDNQDPEVFDQAGNFKNERLFSNINLEEAFNPLVRLDFEMQNSIKILAEMRKDRLLSLSFDNNLLTEIKGEEYILGLGYRIKDVRIRSKLAGPRQIITSDLNLKADISVRDNLTIIRYLDIDNNQITSGQTLWRLAFAADYAFTKNLTGIFYFDYSFSDYAISTAFPQTTIRSGITLRYNFGN